MNYKAQFTRELNNLFATRTKWLRQIVGITRKGRPKNFDRWAVNKSIEKLNEIIVKAKARMYLNKTFKERLLGKRVNYHITGHGRWNRKENFKKWFDKRINHRNVLYIFWATKKQCLYIGRTGRGGHRPSNHFDSYWGNRAKRVTVYKIRGYSYLPMVECLAMHLFDPIHNTNLPSIPKWAKTCPLCNDQHEVREEIRTVFKLR